MLLNEKKVVRIPELEHLFTKKSKNAGCSWNMLWEILYYTRVLKYVHLKQFRKIKVRYNKLCTKGKLADLCSLEFLRSPQKDVYIATDKCLDVLKEAGYNTEILPSESKGIGDINELNNTEVFIEAIRHKDFHALIYPNFKENLGLFPDALLILNDKEMNRYKLSFLEIEAKKPDWHNYIEDKRDKYIRLAQSDFMYEYWQKTAPMLKLQAPIIDKFSFDVFFICNIKDIKKDFGDGFKFAEKLSDCYTMG